MALADLNSQREVSWHATNRGQEIGDQPISANALDRVFKEVLTLPGPRPTPVQFLYSNAVHGAEGPAEKPAQELQVNGPELQGEVTSGGERDRFTFSVTTAGTHTVETSGATDTFVMIFGPDSETRLTAADDEGGPGNLSSLTHKLTAGQYFVRVRHVSRSSTGPYGISVRSS